MIKHIVMWKLKDEAAGNTKEVNLKLMKEKLDALKPLIPELIEAEVGFDFNGSDAAYDIALYTSLNSKEDLDAYQVNEDHVKVKDFIGSITESRVVVDYEI